MTDFEAHFNTDHLEAMFESADIEEAGRKSVRKVVEDMRDHVRAQIVESDIISPARLHSPYEHGPGQSMVKDWAWVIERNGPMNFTLRPHPKVRKRAQILEVGMGPRSRDPDGDKPPYAFEIEGTPIQSYEVDSVKAHGYWRAAAVKMGNQNRLERYFINEVKENMTTGRLSSAGPR